MPRGNSMKTARYWLIAAVSVLAMISPTVHALEAQVTLPPAPVLQPLPIQNNDILIYALEYTNDRGFGLVEIANPTDKYITLNDAELVLSSTGKDSDATEDLCRVPIGGIMSPRSRLLLKRADITGIASPPATIIYSGCTVTPGNNYDKTIALLRSGSTTERVDMPHESTGVYERRAISAASARTGIFATDFIQRSGYAWQAHYLYEPPDTIPLQVIEVLPTTKKGCSAEAYGLFEAGCREYVKVENGSDQPVDLATLRLRYGTPNGTTGVRLGGVVPAGGFMTIYTALDGKQLTLPAEGAIWFEDAMQTIEYPTGIAYAGADLAANLGKSWALFEAGWDWGEPSPGSVENIMRLPTVGKPSTATKELVPCKDGQYRSEETNRCRNIALAGDTLKACKEGQYRSEETNRCRSLAADVAKTLKPCADDQFRNPDTGRCKKIAADDEVLKPCQAGYERNPATNRCRKIRDAGVLGAKAEYPVQPYDQGAVATATWWVVGALAALAAGYGVWEWRSEIGAGLGRLFRRK